MRRALGIAAVAVAAMIAAACTPTTSTTQRLPIGSSCASSGQCGTGLFYCDVGWPDGYCKAQCTSDAACPTGSVCAGATMLSSGACLKQCQSKGDCRGGYLCTPDATASHSYCAPPPATD